jgi:2-hydroxy-4-carboxymuconate semialdehyde hemiacetal dehydrogenase
MPRKVAIAGYGSVAAVHARQMRQDPDIRLTAIYGPRGDKAREFAQAHGIEQAVTSLADALAGADAVVIASPSSQHYEQAAQSLDRGIPTLVELPACASLAEAETLAEKAVRRGVRVACAHTSRYLEPHRMIGEWLRDGRLGEIEQVAYWRHIPPRSRSWTDDALLHHAAHPLDLFLSWFGEVAPLACAAHPGIQAAQNLAIAAKVASAPLSLSISYTARVPKLQMALIGSRHTLVTDGFSSIRSDLAEFSMDWDGQETYERAIREQDAAFLEGRGVPWEDTIALARLVDGFRRCGEEQCG